VLRPQVSFCKTSPEPTAVVSMGRRTGSGGVSIYQPEKQAVERKLKRKATDISIFDHVQRPPPGASMGVTDGAQWEEQYQQQLVQYQHLVNAASLPRGAGLSMSLSAGLASLPMPVGGASFPMSLPFAASVGAPVRLPTSGGQAQSMPPMPPASLGIPMRRTRSRGLAPPPALPMQPTLSMVADGLDALDHAGFPGSAASSCGLAPPPLPMQPSASELVSGLPMQPSVSELVNGLLPDSPHARSRSLAPPPLPMQPSVSELVNGLLPDSPRARSRSLAPPPLPMQPSVSELVSSFIDDAAKSGVLQGSPMRRTRSRGLAPPPALPMQPTLSMVADGLDALDSSSPANGVPFRRTRSRGFAPPPLPMQPSVSELVNSFIGE
jgi:hypothetical protein